MSAQDQNNVFTGLRELYRYFPSLRRWQLYGVLALMLAGAVAELATIGAILPFLALLADPHRLDHAPLLASLFNAIGASTGEKRLFAAATLFIVLAIAAGTVRLQLNWSSQNFIFQLGHDFSVEIQRRLLFQPYEFHINHNTSSLVASLEKVNVLVFFVLLQLMQAAIAVILSVFIIALLICVDPFTAIVAATAFAIIYLLVSWMTRSRLSRSSDIVGRAYDERIKIVQESLGGIRDVIIDNTQPVYLETFRRVDAEFNRARTITSFISTAPRFAIEGLGMALIAVLAIVMSMREGGLAVALPALGALALGAQRLLPLLQQIFVSWSVAVGNSSTFSQVLELLRLPVDERATSVLEAQPLPFRRQISVDDVSLTYANRRAPALEDASLIIKRGQRVALIGQTGSGKSTLADLLMGLIEPTEGKITIDGVPLTRENRRNWQRSIAHVPQAIFLADTSIARNIALGVLEREADLNRVIDAAKKAQLHEFVNSLPEGYHTHVGERGIRLSGGQRQRLGIARAIYKETPILVLDEATSALDDATEKAVMRALDKLGEEGRTIIMIAHRLSTIAGCDIVIRLENGRIVDLGTYAEVVGNTPHSRVL